MSFHNSNIIDIICSRFISISTDCEGSVLNINNQNVGVLFSNCMLHEISSTNKAGCIRTDNTNVSILSCSISYCHPKGGDRHFGNFGYITNSNQFTIESTQSTFSSFSRDSEFTGDSLISLQNSNILLHHL